MIPNPIKPTILVVEDESLVARDIAQQLSDLGYFPAGCASTGEEAIRLAGELRPNLVLMDIKLAGEMEGTAAALAIRNQFALPVVFLTAFAENETLAEAKLSEPFGYIIKPFSERELHTVLQMALYKHEAEMKLRRSEERLRLVLLGSTDAVWDHDLVTGELFRSARWWEMCGYKENELTGPEDPWLRLLHPDDAARAEATFAAARDSKALHYELEARLRHKDGSYIPVLTRAVIVRDPEGRVLRIAGTNTDLRARYATERTLRLRGAALEAAANAILLTDRTGAIEWANPAFTALSGWTLTEIAGKNSRELTKSGEHDAEFYRQMWTTLLAGRVWRGEIVNRRKDGSLRTEDMTITPLRDERGEISHFIAIKQDITDHKAMEAHFLKSQRMEAVGALAGGIAHDLNNILAPITMVTGVLREKFTDAEDRELLAMAQSSAQRGADIVKQLLTFSRGQEGERTQVQPRHLIGEILIMMRETFPRDIEIKQDLPGSLWTVIADPTQLHQVLLNLCVNARDAMPSGGHLTLRAANVVLSAGDPQLPPGIAPGSFLLLTVSDTGHGIPQEIQHRIFDPFFTTKPVGKGTGLGLSTLLGIVRSHGGFVDLDSAPGVGSTFRVYLPALADSSVAPATPPPAPAARLHRGEMILVVDDERNVRDSTRLILERQNYEVITATDGENALAEFLRYRTQLSLIVTDLMMPKMNGVTFVRTVRAINPAIKIIVATGLNEVNEQRELTALGVHQVLLKPFDGPTLLDAVRQLLDAP